MIQPINSIDYNEPVYIVIDDDCGGSRLDRILSDVLCEYSRSFVQNLLQVDLLNATARKFQRASSPKAEIL